VLSVGYNNARGCCMMLCKGFAMAYDANEGVVGRGANGCWAKGEI
jgi:hypothetical protein